MALRFALALLFTVMPMAEFQLVIPTCPEHEVIKLCGPLHPATCENPHPDKMVMECVMGCFCEDGYLRNKQGNCVSVEECNTLEPIPLPLCGEHEEWVSCQKSTLGCKSGCECMEGFVRHANGRCDYYMSVQENNKPILMPAPEDGEIHTLPFPKEGEVHTLPFPGPNDEGIQPLPMPVPKDGIINTLPVPEDDNTIHTLPFPGPNDEIFQPLPAPVPEDKDTVHTLPFPGPNDEVIQPLPAPVPKHGIVHTLPFPGSNDEIVKSKGRPIPAPMCGKNEEWSWCKTCDPTCENPTPKCNRICRPGCQCKKGYFRDMEGNCQIPFVICDDTKPFPLPGGDIEKLQVQKSNPRPMPVPKKPGTIHTLPLPGPNGEFFQRLPMPQDKDTIHILPVPKEGEVHTLPFPGPNDEVIQPLPMPVPKDGTVHTLPIPKDENIPQILPCNAYEVFKVCGSAAPPTCEHPNPLIHIEDCVVGCFCMDGYLRNKKGICVPASQCFASEHKCLTDRETFYNSEKASQLDCMKSCGAPKTPLVHGFPQLSTKCQDVPRKPACICNAPYVRNEMGMCVDKTQCPTNPISKK